jgi:hypothetical protein
MVEQGFHKTEVVGSIPTPGILDIKSPNLGFLSCLKYDKV